MGNYEQLKQAVSAVIKTNGHQEITGAVMQSALLSIISTVGNNATFAGIATPDTNPGTPDQNVFYLAAQPGVYSNFGGVELTDQVLVLSNKNGSWIKTDSGIATSAKVTELDNKTNELNKKVDSQKDEVDKAKDEALQVIDKAEQNAILNFNKQKVTPEMLSQSVKDLINTAGGGTINNMPDDEDIQSVDDGSGGRVLKFNDRAYNPSNFSGKGYKILRKNIVEGKNVLTQEMVNNTNVIYEIRYDFDLNGADITIPEGCTLKFEGGSFKSGTINCNNTNIKSEPYNIFNNIIINGTHSDEANIEWFFDNSEEFYNDAFKNTIAYFNTINFIARKKYKFNKSVIDCCHLKKPYILNGNNCTFYDFSLAYNITKDKNMTPNDTSIIAQHVPNINNISFYRSNDEEYLKYPAIIISYKTEIKNCRFIGYTYCIGITPVYIDSLIIDNIDQWDNKNFLVCCDYNGNVIEDRTFNGDWFYISNTVFLTTENIIYGGMKSTFSILFNNCLHGILSLPKVERYAAVISTILYLHCHFENRQPCIKFIDQADEGKKACSNITFISSFLYSTAIPKIQGINYIDCDINIGNNNNFGIDIQKYLNGTYIIGNASYPIFINTNNNINLNKAPSYSYAYYKIYSYSKNDYKGEDFTYPEDKEECFAYAMSLNPDKLIWNNYENIRPIVFNDYTTINRGDIARIQIFYDSEKYGDINSYILIFKKDKKTEQIYKSYIYVTKELLNSIHNVNSIVFDLTYYGAIGSKWEEFNDELVYKPEIRGKGTFAQKPTSAQGIEVGFQYFCTDKQTKEGATNGIMIYYKGKDVWVDALGRVVS